MNNIKMLFAAYERERERRERKRKENILGREIFYEMYHRKIDDVLRLS